MLKLFSKSSALLAGTVIVAGATVLPLTAISQSPPPVVSDSTTPDAQRLSVIQGRVKTIQGNILTVKTPDLPPYCPPGRVCPAIVVVGPTFTVDISRAIFQSASGSRQRQRPRFKVGNSVVVAGRVVDSLPFVLPAPDVPTQFFAARVVSRAVPSVRSRVP